MRFAPLRVLSLLFPILCLADPQPEPQTYTNNAPFSGAIYIVNPNGQQITATDANMCPSYASVSCGSIGQPSWCCPNSFTCASDPSGLIGCCPAGNSCHGSVNAASVTTVTVEAQHQTAVVYQQPPPPTVQVNNQPTQQAPYQQGFCSTLTMSGPGLPTTRQGSCGVILVVNEATVNLRVLSYGTFAVLLFLQLALGRMFHWF